MRPFSYQEKKNITELLEDCGFRSTLHVNDKERYSIIKDSIIALTVKTPVSIGLNLNIPFEIASFYNTYFFQPRLLNSKVLEMINFLATNLLNISHNMQIEHKFPMNNISTQSKFVDLLNKFMPESYPNETERQWVTRIRLSLMNKYYLFESSEVPFLNKLLPALDSIGMKSTWNVPISLKKGLPRMKRNSILFFENLQNEENEFFLVEKSSFFSFIRDFEVKQIQIRCFFESYTPLLLELVFKEFENFSVKDLILSWIRFSRSLLNPLIGVAESKYINKQEFYPINLNSFFQNDLSDSAIPIPAMKKEIFAKDELFSSKPQEEFLSSPPRSFVELTAISEYNETENLIKSGKLQDAIKILTRILIIFNRFGQKSAVTLVLFKLSDIAQNFGKFQEAFGYLRDALDICKKGDIHLTLILRTHEKLGDLFTKQKEYFQAERHFNIIIKFLIEHGKGKEEENIQLNRLKIAKTMVETNRLKEANTIFKLIFKKSDKNPRILLNFYLERANFFMKKKSVSNAIQILKKGLLMKNLDDSMNLERAKILLELGKLIIYERNIGKRAQIYLLEADKLLDERQTDDLLLKVKIYETLSDTYNKTKSFENMKFYADRARQIIKILQLRGFY